jgi:hypothetical protein
MNGFPARMSFLLLLLCNSGISNIEHL